MIWVTLCYKHLYIVYRFHSILMKYYLFLLFTLMMTSILCAQDGTLDNTFGTGGITKAPLGSTNGVFINTIGDLTKIAVQKDEKIIQVGYKSSSTLDDFVIIRYLKDGALDMSFGLEGGWSATHIAGNDRAHSVAIQADERIVVGGESEVGVKNIGTIVRYLSNGTLDPSFGTGGIVRCDLFTGPSGINAVTLQPDGKIIVAGFASNGTDNDFFVARYLSNGTLDASFGAGGKTVTHFEGNDVATDVKIHTDGRILLAGTANATTTVRKFALALYTSGGLLDPSFAGSGKLITSVIGYGRSAAIDPNGNIHFTGITPGQFTTLSYLMNGAPNSFFGSSGMVQTASLGTNAASRSVHVQCDGKIIVGGERSYTYVVVRYLPNGTIDGTFNGTGKIEVNTGSSNRDYGFSGLAIQEGKILMGGISFTFWTGYTGFFPTVFRIRNPSTIPILQINNPNPVCLPTTVNLTEPSVTAGSEAGLTFSYWLDKHGTLPLPNPNTINTAGTYYIKGTTTAGCFSIKPVTVTFNADLSGTITPAAAAFCTGSSQLLTTLGGTSYQWKKDGVDIIGAIAATYTATTSGNYTVLINNGTCSVLSTNSAITVKPMPTGNITPTSATICSGASQLLSANGGSSYQWSLNGNPISGATGSSYTATSSGTYSIMIFNDGCAGPATNTTTINVTNVAAPSVSITATPTGSLTPGTSITFIAVPTNGGATPLYQWKVNGVNVGSGSSTFTTSTLVNGDVVTAVLTSSLSCVMPVTTTSNPITISIAGVTPVVNISASPTGPVCFGTTVTFMAKPVNGGSSPAYQWKKNGAPVGTNASTFVTNGLSNGDVISLEMTSNASGASPSLVTSNSISMAVTPPVIPSVFIAANPGASVCAGSTVTFMATATNGGTNPIFQWKKNGIVIGTNYTTFTTSTLTNGDIITVELTTNATCASPSTLTSNSLAMNITPLPSGTLSPASATFCPGESQLLTATGGSSYEWYLNGTIISGVTTPSYAATSPGTYSVMIINGGCGSFASNTSVISAGINPSGNITPATAVICAGSAQLLSTSGGTAYQWQKDGIVIPGATNASYSATSTGIYGVIISNAGCAAPAQNTSTVTVNPIPNGTISPSSASICPGGTQTLSTSGGTGYQWSKDGTPISGATEATYIANASGTYSVLISNGTCTAAASNVATVTISATPSGSISPATGSICSGGSQVLRASGGTSYQWIRDGIIITGANTADYTATQGGTYSVLIINGTCRGSASNTAVITLSNAPIGTVSPATASICSGGSQTLTATGGTAYQWYKDGTVITGATADTYVVTLPGNYTTTIFNGSCSGPAANTSVISIAPQPSGTISPSSTTLCQGSSQILTVTGGAAYQWYKDGIAIPGALTANYTAIQSGIYTVLISNNSCTAWSSNSSVVKVTPLPSSNITPASANICIGGSQVLTATGEGSYQWLLNGNVIPGAVEANYTSITPGTYTVNIINGTCIAPAANASVITQAVAPSGTITPAISKLCAGSSQVLTASGGTSYQWRLNGVDIIGATGSTYTATLPGTYTVMILNGSCSGLASNTSIISVETSPTGSIMPADVTICMGTSQTLTANGGTSYQWFNDGTLLVGETGPTYAASVAGIYRAIIYNGNCSAPASNESVVTVASSPSGIITPASAAICPGNTQILSTSGGTSYQWMRNGAAIAGANEATFTTTEEGTYSVVIINGNCSAAASNTSVVRITSLPTGTISPASAIICSGSSQKLSTNGGTSYQWLINGVPIPGAEADSFVASEPGVYKVVINASGCADTASNTSTITITSPTGLITPATAIICPGGSQLLNATGGDTYQWMRDGIVIPGATASSYAAFSPGVYTVQIFEDGCTGITSNSALVTTAPIPSGTISPALDSICRDESKMLTATGGSSYQWHFNGSPITGAVSSTYNASTAGVYSVVIFNGICSAKATNTAVIRNRYQPKGIRYTTVHAAKDKPHPLEAKRTGTSYLWTPVIGLNNAAIRSPLVTTATDKLYTVRIEQLSGCPIIDTVLVKVFDDAEIYVPSGFTPNGDGRNDLLRPIAVQVVQINYFKVFNRWGEIIYQTNSFDGGWNGTYKGKPQPNDTYIWMFEGKDTNGKVVTAKGTTTLVR